MNKHIVAFSKLSLTCPDNKQDNKELVSIVQSELMQLGYMLSEEAFASLSKADPKYIRDWTKVIVEYVNDITGNTGKYVPLHKGFPKSVERKSFSQLRYDQILNYWSNGSIVPDEEEQPAEWSWEYTEFKTLEVIPQTDFNAIFTDLVSLNAALAPRDNEIVEWFLAEYSVKELNKLIPAKVPFKETLCKLAVTGIDVPVKTCKDVLRIAKYINHGDTEIKLPPKKVKLSRGTGWTENPARIEQRWNQKTRDKREYLIGLLEKVVKPSEMVLDRLQWVTLAHCIQSGKFKLTHPRSFESIQLMREKGGYPKSWYGRVDAGFSKSFNKGLEILGERPGEYARRLNELITKSNKPTKYRVASASHRAINPAGKLRSVIDKFISIAPKVSNKVLFELWTYFEGRRVDQTVRKVWTGEKRKPTNLPLLKGLGDDMVDSIVDIIWNILATKFSKLPPLAQCWVDPELKKIPLPTNMKTLSDSLDIVIRGQRNPLVIEKKVLRLYTFWEGRKDLDMSVSILNKDNSITKVGYSGVSKAQGILFSGDNTGNYEMNSEYIDINLEDTIAKYILLSVNVFSNGTDMPRLNTRIGFQEFDTIGKATTNFIPKDVSNSFKVTSKAKQVNLLIFDVETREWILIDEDAGNRAVNSHTEVLKYINDLTTIPKYSVYDLLKLHVENRGTLVEDLESLTEVPVNLTMFRYKDFSKSYTETLKYML